MRPYLMLPLLAALSSGAAVGCSNIDSSELEQTKATELEIVPLDLWAQPLPAGYTLSLSRNGKAVSTKPGADGALRMPLEKGRVELTLSAPEHRDLVLSIVIDGNRSAHIEHESSSLEGATLVSQVDGGKERLSLFLGLRHKWFSAEGRPARAGNRLDLFTSGEEAYGSVAEELKTANDEVLVSTWWWESDFELVRPEGLHTYMSESERKKNTIMSVLESRPAQKRVLVGQLWGQDGVLAGTTVDAPLKAHGDATGDGFEFMGQANGTRGKLTFEIAPFFFGDRVAAGLGGAATFLVDEPIESTFAPKSVDLTAWPVSVDVEHASMHQKFMVVDHEVAFVGGMNLRKVDWDTSDHLVFEPRRMNFGASTGDREDVAAGDALPDNGPRKDYMVRVDGPVAEDVADVFHKRWERAIADKVKYANKASKFEVTRAIDPRADGVAAQVTATLPQPMQENAILETWLNAVEQAHDFVYIEDQYFRAPILNDALFARMSENPELKLVVITKPINEWADPGCFWTYKSAELFASAFPDRFLFLQLRSFATQETFGFDETDAHFVDMDVHSKMFIVDDRFMSVGSCNKNNRGLIYEAELNLAVLDDAWVKAARRRILSEILPPGASVSDDAWQWYGDLRKAASANDAVFARWDDEDMDLDLDGDPIPPLYRPAGFVYSLPFEDSSECLLESVGEDMTGDEVPPPPPPGGSKPDGGL
jgi:hypothetical protein